jgi:hypothetical protein
MSYNQVCTKEEQEVLARGSRKSEQLRQRLMKDRGQEDYDRAVKHKNKLLEFDKTRSVSLHCTLQYDEREHIQLSHIKLSNWTVFTVKGSFCLLQCLSAVWECQVLLQGPHTLQNWSSPFRQLGYWSRIAWIGFKLPKHKYHTKMTLNRISFNLLNFYIRIKTISVTPSLHSSF